MTLLAYKTKPILNLVPEALPFIKLASIDEAFPLDSKESCVASYLQADYMLKIAGEGVDPYTLDNITEACGIYGVLEEAQALSNQMVKKASVRKAALLREQDTNETFLNKQARFESTLSGFKDPVEAAKTATELKALSKTAGVVPSEAVDRYSSNMFIDANALQLGLANRAFLTGDQEFTKVAEFLQSKDVLAFDQVKTAALMGYISELDAGHKLQVQGFDIYKEALCPSDRIKTAMDVTLCNTKVAYTKFAALGHDRVASYLGDDVATELYGSGPMEFKQVAETLPMDMQRMLLNMSKNV